MFRDYESLKCMHDYASDGKIMVLNIVVAGSSVKLWSSILVSYVFNNVESFFLLNSNMLKPFKFALPFICVNGSH